MEVGTHYVMPSAVELYNAKIAQNPQVDFSNPHFDLIIKPFDCTDQLPEALYTKSSNCRVPQGSDSDASKVQLRNKVGS